MAANVSSSFNASSDVLGPANSAHAKPAEIVKLLSNVAHFLQEGRLEEALEVIRRTKVRGPWVTNAAAVCQLRLGNTKAAVDALRGLVLASGGVTLRDDVPTEFKVNFATALLMRDNLEGGLAALADIKDRQHPGVQQLLSAISQWRAGLNWRQKLQWKLGLQSPSRVALDFPVGHL